MGRREQARELGLVEGARVLEHEERRDVGDRGRVEGLVLRGLSVEADREDDEKAQGESAHGGECTGLWLAEERIAMPQRRVAVAAAANGELGTSRSIMTLLMSHGESSSSARGSSPFEPFDLHVPAPLGERTGRANARRFGIVRCPDDDQSAKGPGPTETA